MSEQHPSGRNWFCRFHPTDWWHEVGCPHMHWTAEQLKNAGLAVTPKGTVPFTTLEDVTGSIQPEAPDAVRRRVHRQRQTESLMRKIKNQRHTLKQYARSIRFSQEHQTSTWQRCKLAERDRNELQAQLTVAERTIKLWQEQDRQSNNGVVHSVIFVSGLVAGVVGSLLLSGWIAR